MSVFTFGVLKKVLYGEAPLTLLYTIFFRKGTPFVYLLLEKAPLSYTFLRRLMNKSLIQKVFLTFFHAVRNKLKWKGHKLRLF